MRFDLLITEGMGLLTTYEESEGIRKDLARQQIPFFGITSAFVKAFSPPPVRAQETIPQATEVYRAMLQAYSALSGDAAGMEERLALFDSDPDEFSHLRLYDAPCLPPMAHNLINAGPDVWREPALWYFLEILALRRAVTKWLTPQPTHRPGRYLPPVEVVARSFSPGLLDGTPVKAPRRPAKAEDVLSSFLANALAPVTSQNDMIWLDGLYTQELFNARTQQVGVAFPRFVLIGKRVTSAYSYSAVGLLPLAWAEIMWAISSGTYAHTCDICGGVFALSPPYRRAAYTCSPECARKQKINRMGGIEAARAYNRQAQKKYRERMREERMDDAKKKD